MKTLKLISEKMASITIKENVKKTINILKDKFIEIDNSIYSKYSDVEKKLILEKAIISEKIIKSNESIDIINKDIEKNKANIVLLQNKKLKIKEKINYFDNEINNLIKKIKSDEILISAEHEILAKNIAK